MISDPTLPMPSWARIEFERSRARSCWQTARQLRHYVQGHDWHMNSDDIERTLEQAAELRKEAAEHIRNSKRPR